MKGMNTVGASSDMVQKDEDDAKEELVVAVDDLQTTSKSTSFRRLPSAQTARRPSSTPRPL